MQSSRLELSPLTKEHVAGYFSVVSDFEFAKWMIDHPCGSLQEAEVWMSSMLPGGNPTQETYAILLRSDLESNTIDGWNLNCAEAEDRSSIFVPGGFIGFIGAYTLHKVPEVYYGIHRSAWGHGFATEALLAYTELFWLIHPEHFRMMARCDPENVASGRVLEKSGFEYYDFIYGDRFQPWRRPALRDGLRFVLFRSGYNLFAD
ncbi:GNAT domain-containing protein [Aspergillus caelatus]|uniref:GNAT domain-containing protein n=1 Tax=Aspergillus caelatus TaxID=61420 RepID=A0A5N7ALQ5_9EURO|nr:GNAT domain-containing protein [Aspergillus caelatus]KAE8370755.1 GNAT domain-containing protein [Aspergillus caelatus]